MKIPLHHLCEGIIYLFVLSLPFVNTALFPSITKSFGIQPCHIIFTIFCIVFILAAIKKDFKLKLKNRYSVFLAIIFTLFAFSTTFLFLPNYPGWADSVARISVQCAYLLYAIMVYIVCSFAFSNGISLVRVIKVFEKTFWIVLFFQIYQLGVIVYDLPSIKFTQNNPSYYLQGLNMVGNGLYRLHSTFPEVSMLSSYLGVFFPIFLVQFLHSDSIKIKFFILIKLALITTSLLLSFSFTSMVVIFNAIVLAILFSNQKKKLLIATMLLSVILWSSSEFLAKKGIIANSPLSYYFYRLHTVFTFSEVSAKDRSGSMTAGLKVWEKSPIIGVGEAVYPLVPEARFEGMTNDDLPRVHSLFIKILSEHGLVGLFLYLLILFWSIWYCFKKQENKVLRSINLGYGIAALNIITVQIFTISDFSFTYMWFFLAVTAHVKLLEPPKTKNFQINAVQVVQV